MHHRTAERILDELLVLRAQDGEAEALEELISRWQTRVVHAAFAATGSRDGATEIAQDTWVSVARQIRRLEDPHRFPGWLNRIVARRSVDWIRKQARDRKRGKAAESIATANVEHTNADALKGDRHAQLRAAIAQLSPDQRDVIRLHYASGLSVAELARALRVPEGTIKSRLHAARGCLERAINAQSHTQQAHTQQSHTKETTHEPRQ
ncbi:MAG: RNA polymerase sigma factor [Phycisphaerales bacterium]